MDNIIRKISNFISFVLVFAFSGFFYFGYKGFTVDADGNIVLQKQIAEAATYNGIATVLPRNISINASTRYSVGPANAPLTLYEYSSLGCPHCADFHLNYAKRLENEYVSKGLLRIVFVNFPLDKKSMQGAMISQCLGYEANRAFIDRLFSKQRSWWLANNETPLVKYAMEFGLSPDEAVACMNNDEIAKDIIDDRQQALNQLRMQGTPAFLFKGADGNEIIYGVPSYKKLKEYLDSRLAHLL